MLDLGFVTAILADNTFQEVLEVASKERFKCVEVMCWPQGKAERRYAGVTHIDVDGLDDRKVNEIKELTEKYGVYISGLGYYPNPLDPDEEKALYFRNHIKKVIKAAHLLGIKTVNTFTGRNPSLNIDRNIDIFKKVWPEIIVMAEDYGINIGIENCPMFFTDDEWPGGKNLATTPKIWDILFDIIPNKNFGLNYDPSHLVCQQMDYISPIYQYKDRLHHIHLKDAKVYKEKLDRVGIMANPLEYHSPKLPGLGDVDWGKFISALTDVRYRGPVCIEVEDKAFEGSLEDIMTSLKVSRNHLEQFLNL
jgi:sugar phosphate isomerase/epimerase